MNRGELRAEEGATPLRNFITAPLLMNGVGCFVYVCVGQEKVSRKVQKYAKVSIFFITSLSFVVAVMFWQRRLEHLVLVDTNQSRINHILVISHDTKLFVRINHYS